MAADFDGIDATSIFHTNGHELSDASLLTPFSDEHFDLVDSKATDAAFEYNAYDSLGIYEQYQESGPSSVHFGDGNGLSEHGGNHMNGSHELHMDKVQPDDREHQATAGAQRSISTSISASPAKTNGITYANIQPLVASDQLSSIKRPSSIAKTVNDVAPAISKTIIRHNAITPESSDTPKPVPTKKRKLDELTPKRITSADYRIRSSIPPHLSWMEYARQGILAAYSSRLNPYALHPGEYHMLREHITRLQVTTYLNIRNGILRLWHRNPMVGISRQEAAGCCKESKYFGLAEAAYDWLLRNGYVNFGCVQLPNSAQSIPRAKAKGGRRKTIVVVGAGMAGLGCARQLEGLISQLGEKFTDKGDRPPKIVLLEGRNRVGGRVYSHQYKNQKSSSLAPGQRCTAEMGAQIITGFEHGNPMNAIVRGQLGLQYHALRDNSVLYDHDGRMVDKHRDTMVERLYNDVLERAAFYRNKLPTVRTVQGDEMLIRYGEDPKETAEKDCDLISSLEDAGVEVTVTDGNPVSTNKAQDNSAVGVVKEGGRSYQLAGSAANRSAAEAARLLGWELKASAKETRTLDLESSIRNTAHPTLGETMDEGLRQYQEMLSLTPEDLRLFNWHHANLEYANAANVNLLSLGGWDQDVGNEFEGEHTEIIGGYSQVPRALSQLPTPLDLRFKHAVKGIKYKDGSKGSQESPRGDAPVLVECHNGEKIECDEVVLTIPLGVLKQGSIKFTPPLPDWKVSCVERMGFGLLNKVVLVYEKVFWDNTRDMFGLLNESADPLNQKSYAKDRGRFYLFWNRTKQSGKPTLVALMAGTAAYSVEQTDNDSLVREATERLQKIFRDVIIPAPSESIVTRWRRDPFANGSYSFVGAETKTGDYDLMAKSVGPIHFAGEATCGTHPATVHGAYISGLRAAADVINSLLGPLELQKPLVPRGPVKIKPEPAEEVVHLFPGTKKQKGYVDIWEPILPPPEPNADANLQAEVEGYEAQILSAIFAKIGERPLRPEKRAANPYLMYQDEHWYAIKSRLEASTGKKPSRNEVRLTLGAEWRGLSEEMKKPYVERADKQRADQERAFSEFAGNSAVWDREAAKIRGEFLAKEPPSERVKKELEGRTAVEFGGGRAGRKLGGYGEISRKKEE